MYIHLFADMIDNSMKETKFLTWAYILVGRQNLKEQKPVGTVSNCNKAIDDKMRVISEASGENMWWEKMEERI